MPNTTDPRDRDATTTLGWYDEVLDLSAIYGDYAQDYDHAAVLGDYLDAINTELPDGHSLYPNGELIGPVDSPHTGDDVLDIKAIADGIDITPILERHDTTRQRAPRTMLEMKGPAYVATWPTYVADKIGLSVEYLATAINTIIPAAGVHQMAFYPGGSGDPARQEHALDVVGGLTPESAKAVTAELRRVLADINRAQSRSCRYCGLPLRGGQCEQCG